MKDYKTVQVSVSAAYSFTPIYIFQDSLCWKIFCAFLLKYNKTTNICYRPLKQKLKLCSEHTLAHDSREMNFSSLNEGQDFNMLIS